MIYSLSFSRKLDYIPFVACLKNFFEIFEKYVLKKAPFKESHSLIHLQEKTFLERVILLIPFFGNIFIYKHRKKTLIEFLADCANQKSIPIGVSFSKEEITSEPVKKHLLDSMDSFKTKDAKKIVASMIMAYDNQDDLIEAIKVKNP